MADEDDEEEEDDGGGMAWDWDWDCDWDSECADGGLTVEDESDANADVAAGAAISVGRCCGANEFMAVDWNYITSEASNSIVSERASERDGRIKDELRRCRW